MLWMTLFRVRYVLNVFVRFGIAKQKPADEIENLMALCRICHTEYGDIKDLKDMLKKIHKKHLDNRE